MTTQPANDAAWDFDIGDKGVGLGVALREFLSYRDLVIMFARRDITAIYKQTLLGPSWIIIQPLLTTALYALVFGRIANLPTGEVPDLLFYLWGVTFWGFFAAIFTETANLFVRNEDIFSKVYFPRLISAAATLLSQGMVFIAQLSVSVTLTLIFYRDVLADRMNRATFLTPLFLLIIASFALGLGLLIAASTVRYRDLRKLLNFGTQLLLYATPVIYPFALVPGSISRILSLNPLVAVFEGFRWGFFDTEPVTSGGLLYSAVVALATLAFGVVAFHRVERRFVDEI